jgi:predicted RNase H-like HicB family nuclease
MTRDFNVIIERDSEGYYVATVPTLKGCYTQAKSLDKLMERVHEAIGSAWRSRVRAAMPQCVKKSADRQ